MPTCAIITQHRQTSSEWVVPSPLLHLRCLPEHTAQFTQRIVHRPWELRSGFAFLLWLRSGHGDAAVGVVLVDSPVLCA
jgi:hypothetical protein